MSAIQGTNVAAPITPFDTGDSYPTHDERYGRGGFRTVADLANRNAIPNDRRKNGMRVYVIETGREYVLAKDDTNASDAGTWDLTYETQALQRYQVSFFAAPPVVDPSAGKVRYPRMAIQRGGQAYKDLNPTGHAGGVNGYFELTYQPGGTATFHYIDASLIGTTSNPVKEISGAQVPDLVNKDIIPLGWTLDKQYHCFWTRRVVRYGTPSGSEVIFVTPPIDDRFGALGGGAALYIPTTPVFMHSPELGLNVDGGPPFTVANADAGGAFAGYCKLVIPAGFAGTLSFVVYDIDNSLFKIVTYPNYPGLPGGGANGYRYICIGMIAGNGAMSSPTGVAWVNQSRLTRPAVHFRRPLVADNGVLLIPPFYSFDIGGSSYSGLRAPTDGSQFWEQAISAGAASPRRHYFDSSVIDAGGTVEGALKIANDNAFPIADGHRQAVLATSIANQIDPLGHALARIVPNQCPYGKGVASDSMPLLSNAAYGDITSPALTALGFTRGFVSSNAAPAGKNFFAGMNFPDARLGGTAFFRMYVQTDTADNFGTQQQVFFWNGSGVLTSMLLTLEKKLSATAAIFSGRFAIPTNWTGLTHFFMGVGGSAGVTLAICGFQFHHSGLEADWIARADYPTAVPDALRLAALEQATTVPSGTDLKPLFGDELFLVSDRALSVYPLNMFGYRGDADIATVSIDTVAGLPTPLFPPAVSKGPPIAIDYARASGAATLRVRPTGTPATRYTKALTVYKKAVPVSGTPAVKILGIGDSITRRATLFQINQCLVAWGFAPTFIGTLEGEGATTSYNGPVGEGREGWALSDFFLTRQDSDVTAVLAAGGEDGYRAAGQATRQATNVFLQAAGSSASAAPTVTYGGVDYKFDLAFYQSRFGFAAPDVVLLNLGKNDQLEQAAAVALADVTTLYDAMLAEIRRAWPNAQIICWATTMPYDGTTDWQNAWYPLIRTMNGIVKSRRGAGDTKLHMCSTWAHASQEGFALNAGTVDAVTGVTTTTYSDKIHPIGITRSQHAEALAAAIACLVPA